MGREARSKKELLLEIDRLRAELAETQQAIHAVQSGEVNARVHGSRILLLPNARRQQKSRQKPGRSSRAGAAPQSPEQLLRSYHQIFFHANQSIVNQDIQGRIIEQNATHQTLLGYGDDELLGKTPAHYLEGGMEEFRRTMDDLLQWGNCRRQARCRTKSGRWIEAEFSSAVIRNDAGDIIGCATFMHEITEKKRMEDALRESEERFAAFMNNSSVAAYMRDDKGRYVYVNKAFEKYIGKPSPEIVGKTVFDIWPAEIARVLSATDQRVLVVHRPMEVCEKTALPDNPETTEWLSIKFPFRDRMGKVYVGCVSIDITERKSLEEQLRQSQKMEAVGRLAGGVAHDFNNLLTIIVGYCELLLESSGIDESQQTKIAEIKKAGDRAALLTRQLLAFSRKQVLAPRVLDLSTVVENLRKMIERLIGEDINLVTASQAALWLVKADPGQVEQIIMNLVVNARDAMPHGGTLTIEMANVQLDKTYVRSHVPTLPGDYVMIAVSDTGTGMDRETQKHIFEPFFTTKDKGKGTGLGLAMVYGIVKQSDGFIWVYSEPDIGTTFKIYFPCVQENRELRAARKLRPERLKGSETILVAEDEDSLRLLIRETLKAHGYKVLEAANGKEAVTISERYRKPIHLLVADVVMPQMSGRQLVELLTAARPELEVLYISGYTDDAIVHHGVIDPNVAFLQKPFSPDGLAKKVRLVLGQRVHSKS